MTSTVVTWHLDLSVVSESVHVWNLELYMLEAPVTATSAYILFHLYLAVTKNKAETKETRTS
jgi:hypothetical protein